MMGVHYRVRAVGVFIIFCSLYLLIIGALYFIQIKNSLFFSELGEKQYTSTMRIKPARAEILDRTGLHPLATNRDSIAAFILPHQLSNPAAVKAFLSEHFPQAAERLEQTHGQQFMFIKRRLSAEQVTLIEESKVVDIKLLKEPSRLYPVESAGIITGITDIDNAGALGIERQFDAYLTGTETVVELEKDARSGYFYFTKTTKVEGQAPQPLRLTLDADLQFLVAQELQETVAKLAAKEGAVIVMNPYNGDILAMASSPDFNPNSTEHLTLDHTKNRLITDAHELGSVMKIFAALAALEEGVVTNDELINCKNTRATTLDGIPITTWREDGIIPFAQVIATSNNIGTAQVAQRLGHKLYDHYVRLGFGSKTGIPLPGEHLGFVNHPANWSRYSILSLSYGYEVTATLLQLARAFCIIANGGYAITPRLILEENAPDPILTERLYSQESILNVYEIMQQAATSGTARYATIKGYTVLGKTGSANLVVNGQYDPTKSVFTFCGLIKKGSYCRVIVTFLKEIPRTKVYAATISAPFFGRVAEKMLIHDRIINEDPISVM